jgi:hypothetical protein
VIDTSSGTATMSNVTIMDFVFEGVHVTSGDLQSTDVIYYRNGTGARVSGSSATATFDQCNFAQNTETGVQIDIGTATITNSSFSGNVSYGVRHTGGTVSIGTVPGNGNTFTVPSGATGISSIGTGATIRDNTISGGLRGIYLGAAASSIYANTVSGASSYQIECATTSVAGAGFNYIGGNYGGGGSNCSDATDQLGSPIVSWTGNNTLGGCTVSSAGPIFDLGNVSPYGLTPPQGRNSKYYAVTSAAGNVTVTGGSTQFKMYMDGTDTGAGGTDVCNPMTYACWEANGGSTPRVQSGAGYYFSGTLDPTAISLRSLTASSARNTWLPAILLGAALLLGGGGLLLVRRRR